ncbi:MAG: DUF1365 domain-containing protein [Candidatus Eisenbacteria bacterium]|nr:DUF1365 domain-containing protein [Candidatus Eisenbacteria bacterium]
MDRPVATPLNSRLYVGRLVHRRYRPRPHRFSFPIYMHLIDLGELPEMERRLKLFSVNRFNVVSLHDGDHLGSSGRGLKAAVLEFLSRHGVDLTGGRIELLTHLRILGYAFNPVSFFYCHDAEGVLRCVVAEVRNTFGERHAYLLDERCATGVLTFETPKEIFVSPFARLDGRWSFRFNRPARGLSVHMKDFDGQGRFLDATLSGASRPLTNRTLLVLLLLYPFMTLQVIARIHWEALRLWLKRVPHFKHVARRTEEYP